MNASELNRVEVLKGLVASYQKSIGAHQVRVMFPPVGIREVELYRETERACIAQLRVKIAACEAGIADLTAQGELCFG